MKLKYWKEGNFFLLWWEIMVVKYGIIVVEFEKRWRKLFYIFFEICMNDFVDIVR